MRLPTTPRHLFLAALGLVIATNAFVLLGVWLNRTGEATSQIILSERELALPYWTSRENSGLALRLDAELLGGYGYDSSLPRWFDADKLESLGFELDSLIGVHRKRSVSKEVFIVLEYDGPAYREALSQAQFLYDEAVATYRDSGEDKRYEPAKKSTEASLKQVREHMSRLFAVDVGLDAAVLRAAYPDKARYILAKGIVMPSYNYAKERKDLQGYIRSLSVSTIHVSRSERAIFDACLEENRQSRTTEHPPRYTVELAYGSRYEPWIVSVKRYEEKP